MINKEEESASSDTFNIINDNEKKEAQEVASKMQTS